MNPLATGTAPATAETTPVAGAAVGSPATPAAGAPVGTAPTTATARTSGVTDSVMSEPAVTAAELLGMNPGDFATTMFEKFPPGRFMFRINEMTLDVKDTKNGPTNVVVYEHEVVQVISVTKEGVDPQSLVGRKFYDNNYLNGSNREEVAKAIEMHNGHVATLLGVKELSKEYQSFQKLFETLSGRVYFVASITETKNDKNPDDPYTNLNTRVKVISHRELAETGQLPEPAAPAA